MKVKKEIKIEAQYTVRKLQEFAIAEMCKSIPEHEDKTDPQIGAILTKDNEIVIAIVHRGELRAGDHAEFTVLERKCRHMKVDRCFILQFYERL